MKAAADFHRVASIAASAAVAIAVIALVLLSALLVASDFTKQHPYPVGEFQTWLYQYWVWFHPYWSKIWPMLVVLWGVILLCREAWKELIQPYLDRRKAKHKGQAVKP